MMNNKLTISALIISLLLSLCLPQAAKAEIDDFLLDLDPELAALLDSEEDVTKYTYPEIAPTGYAHMGFRIVDITGPTSILRFGDIDDSVTFKGRYRSFEFPNRFYFIYDREGENVYFSEMRYAYGDTVVIRWIGNGLHRNPESVVPIDIDTATTYPGVSVNDMGHEYGINKNTETFFIRLKHPNAPAHLILGAWRVHEEGSMQERTLLGSGWHNEIIRDVNKREYEWETNEYTVGINGNFGQGEIEIIHTDNQFNMISAPSTTDAFSASTSRAAGNYDHHLYSESTLSSNEIKLHTSYTGRLVGSTSISKHTLKSDENGIEVNYLYGSAALTWMPKTSLTWFLRYTHSDLDYDSTLQRTAPILRQPKAGTSATRDNISLTARFRPIPAFVLRAKYTSQTVNRPRAMAWGLSSDKTQKDSFTLSARSKQIKGLTVKGEYEYTDTENPAYNTEADTSHKIKASVRWRASKKAMTFINVLSEASKRHQLQYANNTLADNRLAFRDSVLAGITYTASEKLSITTSLNYYLNSIKQDIVYDLGGSAVMAPDTVYEDKVYGISMDLSYIANEKLSLMGSVALSETQGSFLTHNVDLIDISPLVNQDISMLDVYAAAQYAMDSGLDMELELMYKKLTENYTNPYDALSDGDAMVAMVKVGKKW